MKIKGYEPADIKIGQEIGVEAEYYTEWGKVHARIKHTGTDNVAFREAMDKKLQRDDIRNSTGYKTTSVQRRGEVAELYYDHAIISWATDVIDEDVDPDKPIKATRENFIKLMSLEYFDKTMAQIVTDCHNRKLFIKEAENKTVKNS